SECDAHFARWPLHEREDFFMAHDRITWGLAGRPDHHPARVTAEKLQIWTWVAARHDREVVAITRALNRLMQKAVAVGFRSDTVHVTAGVHAVPVPTIH